MSIKNKLQVYSQSGCGACNKLKEVLKANNIKFKEKDVNSKYEEEFDTLAEIIGVWTTPTLVYNGNVLVNGRDFKDFESLPHVLKVFSDSPLSLDRIAFERFKTFEANTQSALEYIVETLSKLETREYKLMYRDKENNNDED